MKDLSLWQQLMMYLNKYRENKELERLEAEYSPEHILEEYNMPKSRQEILKWARIYFNTEATVQNIVEENALGAIPFFTLSTSDPALTKFYNEMAFNDRFNLYDFMKLFSLSFHKFGEAIPFGNLEEGDDGKWRWSNFILLEPELVEVKSDMISGERTVSLIPTEEIKELVHGKPSSVALLDPEIVAAVNEHRNINLSDDRVSFVARITDPSAVRGTSPIQCLFKVLAFMDKMRLSKNGSDEDFEYCKKQLSLGLKLSDMHLRSRRDSFETWMLNKYFKPIAEKNGFKSKGKLILPKITWQTK